MKLVMKKHTYKLKVKKKTQKPRALLKLHSWPKTVQSSTLLKENDTQLHLHTVKVHRKGLHLCLLSTI